MTSYNPGFCVGANYAQLLSLVIEEQNKPLILEEKLICKQGLARKGVIDAHGPKAIYILSVKIKTL